MTDDEEGDDALDELAARAFKLFHDFDLTCDTVEEAALNDGIAFRSVVTNLDKLCRHDVYGLCMLVDRLVKRQLDRHHKH
jgi:hypothetical protein